LAVTAVVALVQVTAARQAEAQAAIESYEPAETAADTVVEQDYAVFFGDSYSQGTGATTPENRWTTLVSEAKGWIEENRALGATGYLATSGVNGCGLNLCPNYGTVVTNSTGLNADTFFVAGGQNDFSQWRADSSGVTAAIDKTYDDLRAAYPDARIIAVGPSTVGSVNATVTAMDSAVQNAAARVGAPPPTLIDPNVVTPEMIAPDGGHVLDAGHRAIADRVLAALE
jgi:lysophospholipase L1-like esterase